MRNESGCLERFENLLMKLVSLRYLEARSSLICKVVYAFKTRLLPPDVQKKGDYEELTPKKEEKKTPLLALLFVELV